MLRRAVFAACSFVLLGCLGPIAVAQEMPEQPTKGDGGLHVSNGGMFAGVGGSGSFSGTVRGPGGGGGSQAPAPAVSDASAVHGGAVAPAEVKVAPAEPLTQTQTASASPLGPILAIALVGVAAMVLFARRPQPTV